MALLNDTTTVKLIHTIARFIPDDCTEEDVSCRLELTTGVPLSELDSETINWSDLI